MNMSFPVVCSLVLAAAACRTSNSVIKVTSEVAPSFADNLDVKLPLQTCDRSFVDADFKEFHLNGINLPGASDRALVPYGLDVIGLRDYAKLLKQAGFTVVRLPYADVIFYVQIPVPDSLLAANLDGADSLRGMTPYDVYKKTVEVLTQEGLLVILNDHSTSNLWCCKEFDHNGLWNGLQSNDTFYEHLTRLATDFKDNPRVIGIDLRNEIRKNLKTATVPHWNNYPLDTVVLVHTPQNNWHAVAEEAGKRVLAIRSDWLIFVEGLQYARDFRGIGAMSSPVLLPHANRLAYSPHAYSFHGSGNENTYDEYWGYLLDPDRLYTAPIWIGEFGEGGASDWWNHTVDYIQSHNISAALWSSNPERYDSDQPNRNFRLKASTTAVTAVPDCHHAENSLASASVNEYAACLMLEKAALPRPQRAVFENYGILHRSGEGGPDTKWFLDPNDFRLQAMARLKPVASPVDPAQCADNFGYRWARFKANGSCLDVKGGGGGGVPIDTFGCHSGRNQQFRASGDITAGPVQLIVRYTFEKKNLCVIVRDNQSVVADLCDNAQESHFWKVNTNDTGVNFESVHFPGRCLGSDGGMTACGSKEALLEMLKTI